HVLRAIRRSAFSTRHRLKAQVTPTSLCACPCRGRSPSPLWSGEERRPGCSRWPSGCQLYQARRSCASFSAVSWRTLSAWLLVGFEVPYDTITAYGGGGKLGNSVSAYISSPSVLAAEVPPPDRPHLLKAPDPAREQALAGGKNLLPGLALRLQVVGDQGDVGG